MQASTEHASFRDDGLIIVRDVRIVRQHIFSAWTGKQKAGEAPKEKKFSAQFLLPLTTHRADIIAIRDFAHKMCKSENKGALIPAEKFFIRDGAQSGVADFAGHWLIAASETNPPVVVGRRREPLKEEDRVIYNGCRVNAVVRPWWQNNEFGRRVNAGLMNVQFFRDDEPMGAGSAPRAEDVFEEFEDDDDSGQLPLDGDGLGL